MGDTTVIVGANLAGGRAAEALRREGFEGRIVLVGEEPWRPYERPPLSKELLWGPTHAPQNFFLQQESFYDEQRIELSLGRRVTELDLARQRVMLDDGAQLPADRILLCTGGHVRRLPVDGADLGGVFYMRTLADSEALAARMIPGTRVVIIGMGVIGAEVAASARKRGCEVTAVEPFPAPMTRLFGQHYGCWLGDKHRRHGVCVFLRTGVQRLVGRNGEVNGVVIGEGQFVPADLVVVGIGIEPAVDLALHAGLEVSNGIVVDRHCRTSSPLVWAAGDVACQPDFFDPAQRARLETFQNAQDQAIAAAASMVGRPTDYLRPAWFWTDQYDLNVQLSGRIQDGATRVVRGSEEAENFTAFFLRAGVVEGVLTVNRAHDMGAGKRLVERRASVAAELLADESLPLRSLLANKR